MLLIQRLLCCTLQKLITKQSVWCASFLTVLKQKLNHIQVAIRSSRIHCLVNASFGSVLMQPLHHFQMSIRSCFIHNSNCIAFGSVRFEVTGQLPSDCLQSQSSSLLRCSPWIDSRAATEPHPMTIVSSSIHCFCVVPSTEMVVENFQAATSPRAGALVSPRLRMALSAASAVLKRLCRFLCTSSSIWRFPERAASSLASQCQ